MVFLPKSSPLRPWLHCSKLLFWKRHYSNKFQLCQPQSNGWFNGNERDGSALLPTNASTADGKSGGWAVGRKEKQQQLDKTISTIRRRDGWNKYSCSSILQVCFKCPSGSDFTVWKREENTDDLDIDDNFTWANRNLFQLVLAERWQLRLFLLTRRLTVTPECFSKLQSTPVESLAKQISFRREDVVRPQSL